MAAHLHVTGVTLVELLIALSIGALLMALGMPSFSTFLRNSEIRSNAESIANGIRVARNEAIRRNLQVSFTLVSGGPSWTSNEVASGTLVQQYNKLEAGTNTQITITPNTAVSAVFDGLGRLVLPTPNPPYIQQIDISSVVAGQGRPLRIYIDDAHGVKMCDPDAALAALSPPDARAC